MVIPSVLSEKLVSPTWATRTFPAWSEKTINQRDVFAFKKGRRPFLKKRTKRLSLFYGPADALRWVSEAPTITPNLSMKAKLCLQPASTPAVFLYTKQHSWLQPPAHTQIIQKSTCGIRKSGAHQSLTRSNIRRLQQRGRQTGLLRNWIEHAAGGGCASCHGRNAQSATGSGSQLHTEA
jgi:hypothetical protein